MGPALHLFLFLGPAPLQPGCASPNAGRAFASSLQRAATALPPHTLPPGGGCGAGGAAARSTREAGGERSRIQQRGAPGPASTGRAAAALGSAPAPRQARCRHPAPTRQGRRVLAGE